MIWLVAVVVVVVLVGTFLILRRRPHQEPGVVKFRRHIDALSSEARREVMDRVRPTENRPDHGSGNDGSGNDGSGNDGPGR